MNYPKPLLALIQHLRRLPGVGQKSAERFAFHLLTLSTAELGDFARAIAEIQQRVGACSMCGAVAEGTRCSICDHPARDTKTICVVASPRDVFAVERTGHYRGLYHVLGGLLSPLERKGPEHLAIDSLKERIATLPAEEVILALDSTLEGDATALFLKEELCTLSVSVSRIAFGLPIGSAFDGVDGYTLGQAFTGRRQVS